MYWASLCVTCSFINIKKSSNLGIKFQLKVDIILESVNLSMRFNYMIIRNIFIYIIKFKCVKALRAVKKKKIVYIYL